VNRRRSTRHDERGQSEVEAALIIVGLFVFVFLPIAFGVYFHATEVATAAAQEGARVARTGDADPLAAVNTYLDRVGGKSLTDRQVQVTGDADTVCVKVDGYANVIIPGLRIAVHARSAGIREQFRPENQRYRPNIKC
jgi:Flp pilus assembly protein TadG